MSPILKYQIETNDNCCFDFCMDGMIRLLQKDAQTVKADFYKLHSISFSTGTCRDRLEKLNNAPGYQWETLCPMKAKRILISQKLVSPNYSHINFSNQR